MQRLRCDVTLVGHRRQVHSPMTCRARLLRMRVRRFGVRVRQIAAQNRWFAVRGMTSRGARRACADGDITRSIGYR